MKTGERRKKREGIKRQVIMGMYRDGLSPSRIAKELQQTYDFVKRVIEQETGKSL